MTRDLAGELEFDRRRRERDLLVMLRDAVLEARRRVRLARINSRMSDEERSSVALTFDADGMGPFLTITPEVLSALGEIAERAKEAA